MTEETKVYLNKKNIGLIMLIIICMILIFITALKMIFPSNEISSRDEAQAKKIIESFIDNIGSKKNIEVGKYMIDDWKNEDVSTLFIGYEELDKLSIEKINLDKHAQYCEKYLSGKKDIKGQEYASFTVELKHDYKKGSKYKDETKKMVFLMEKGESGWRIITFGTAAMIGSLI